MLTLIAPGLISGAFLYLWRQSVPGATLTYEVSGYILIGN